MNPVRFGLIPYSELNPWKFPQGATVINKRDPQHPVSVQLQTVEEHDYDGRQFVVAPPPAIIINGDKQKLSFFTQKVAPNGNLVSATGLHSPEEQKRLVFMELDPGPGFPSFEAPNVNVTA
jgi:hypothetical protein